jgi:hypothetical protein
MTPPTHLTQRLVIIEAPTKPAVVPNARKIIESPALNANELIITARRAFPPEPPSLRLSMLTPDISEM